ncbi:MAG TPA: hypothetical protein VEF06_02720 [Bryobacteraceae bacterium]|nr:hypothetical protein [Bryobacteraceae bacterium]
MSIRSLVVTGILALALVGCNRSRSDEGTQRPGDLLNAIATHSSPAPKGPTPTEMAGNTLPEAPGYGMMLPEEQTRPAKPKGESVQARR